MNNKLTAEERVYVDMVKALPCSVCNAPPPSQAHHFKQHLQYTTIALCIDCHKGAFNGWHGQKTMWRVMKMEQIDALELTIKRVIKNMNL